MVPIHTYTGHAIGRVAPGGRKRRPTISSGMAAPSTTSAPVTAPRQGCGSAVSRTSRAQK